MRIRVEAALFAKEAYRWQLFELLGCVQRGHIVEVEPGDAPELEEWLGGLGRLKDECHLLLELALEDSAHSAIETQAVVADLSTSDWSMQPLRLTLPDSLQLLHHPLSVLVENERRDGAFLRSVGWRYRSTMERLEQQRRLRITHGGGLPEIGKIIQHYRDPLWRQRTAVVFDSDALAPQQPSPASAKLGHICEETGVPYHRLLRRNAESYLPPATVLAWADRLRGDKRRAHLKRARAFSRLSPEQRHHYNMKEGHKGDAKRTDCELGRALFEGTDEQTMRSLDEGFGRDIGDLFADGIEPMQLQEDGQDSEMSELFDILLKQA